MSSTLHFQGQSTLSELFTIVYVMVDDYLKRSVAIGRFSLPIAENQKGSYAELMTPALVGELRSQDHVGDWFDSVKVEYATLFPELPHRTRYYRVLKRLERLVTHWLEERREGAVKIDWQFTTSEARIKLKRLYPEMTD